MGSLLLNFCKNLIYNLEENQNIQKPTCKILFIILTALVNNYVKKKHKNYDV